MLDEEARFRKYWEKYRTDRSIESMEIARDAWIACLESKPDWMNREIAIEIARRCARNRPQNYYSEPFTPHEWVIDAIMQGSMASTSSSAAQPPVAGTPPGQVIADDILRRIALRYRNCEVNIYPDLPELTPVEAVLRCAQQEGFHLTNSLAAQLAEPEPSAQWQCTNCGMVGFFPAKLAVGPDGKFSVSKAEEQGTKIVQSGTPPGQSEGKCGEFAGHFIAGASWFPCALPKGHEGEHQRGGTCFKHGEYVGEQCPKWPNCVEGVPF